MYHQRTQNQQKCRISVILGIVADGSILAPLIIFKDKERFQVHHVIKVTEDGFVSKKGGYIIIWNHLGTIEKIISSE